MVVVGRTERGWVSEALEVYVGRSRRGPLPIELHELAATGKGDPAHQQRTEGEKVLAALRPEERVVVLDEHGRAFSSPGLTTRLGDWRDQGIRSVAFVIGGAYGHDQKVLDRADLVLSLSEMTFPHQLVRVMLAEQLYRCGQIMQGTGYHH